MNYLSHQMYLKEGTALKGLWDCPDCGRRFILQPGPPVERLVLDHGDESVCHIGSVGDVAILSIGQCR